MGGICCRNDMERIGWCNLFFRRLLCLLLSEGREGTAVPDYSIRFGKEDFYDTYPNSIVGVQLQEQMQKKLSVYFPECFVYAYARAGKVTFSSREEVTIEEFVKRSEDPSVRYSIGVNQNALQSEDYGEECDFLFECLAEMNEESAIDGTQGVYFLPESAYNQYYEHYQEKISFAESRPEFLDDYSQIGMGFYVVDGSKTILMHGICGSLESTKISKEEYIELRKEMNKNGK